LRSLILFLAAIKKRVIFPPFSAGVCLVEERRQHTNKRARARNENYILMNGSLFCVCAAAAERKLVFLASLWLFAFVSTQK
jgi:hypothetical protein